VNDVSALPGLMSILILLALLVAVLWILLPFAVFGLKGLLRDAIAQQRRTNELLERMAAPPTARDAFEDTKPGRRSP
jgi:hypothetical protein